MSLEHFGSVSVSISVAKRVTPFKNIYVINPAHSSIIIPEKLSLTEYAEDDSEDTSNDRKWGLYSSAEPTVSSAESTG